MYFQKTEGHSLALEAMAYVVELFVKSLSPSLRVSAIKTMRNVLAVSSREEFRQWLSLHAIHSRDTYENVKYGVWISS